MLVRDLELSARPLYLLTSMWGKDVTTEFIAAKTNGELSHIKGMGPKYLREVREAIPYTGDKPNVNAKTAHELSRCKAGGMREELLRSTKPPPVISASPVAGMVVKVRIDPKLAHRVEEFLLARGLTLDQAVGLYLRAMINTSAKSRALRLADAMPFGKYQGERIETILRVQPDYIAYLVANSTNTRWDPEVLRMLEELTS